MPYTNFWIVNSGAGINLTGEPDRGERHTVDEMGVKLVYPNGSATRISEKIINRNDFHSICGDDDYTPLDDFLYHERIDRTIISEALLLRRGYSVKSVCKGKFKLYSKGLNTLIAKNIDNVYYNNNV